MNESVPRILVTGGAGFIGSAVCRQLVDACDASSSTSINSLTRPDLRSFDRITDNPRYSFERIDVCDREALNTLFGLYQPTGVIHLAAESHVDRSISGAEAFLKTNIEGTFHLLEAARRFYESLNSERRPQFRFVHVSTDEVYGSLGSDGLFREDSPYQPSSPYSASKAASDHLAHAWHKTYGLPVIISNCSNNYGPYQFPEKLIPLTVLNAFEGKALPVYGAGSNIRDWLYVDDHARGLIALLRKGRVGEKYNFGGDSERTNLNVVELICDILDRIAPTRQRKTIAHHFRRRSARSRSSLCDRRIEGARRARMAAAALIRKRLRTYDQLVPSEFAMVAATAGASL